VYICIHVRILICIQKYISKHVRRFGQQMTQSLRRKDNGGMKIWRPPVKKLMKTLCSMYVFFFRKHILIFRYNNFDTHHDSRFKYMYATFILYIYTFNIYSSIYMWRFDSFQKRTWWRRLAEWIFFFLVTTYPRSRCVYGCGILSLHIYVRSMCIYIQIYIRMKTWLLLVKKMIKTPCAMCIFFFVTHILYPGKFRPPLPVHMCV